MGIFLTRQEPIISFLINTEPHHQHHSYRQHDHDLGLQNGQYCWRVGHELKKTVLVAVRFVVIEKILKEKTVQKFISPFF